MSRVNQLRIARMLCLLMETRDQIFIMYMAAHGGSHQEDRMCKPGSQSTGSGPASSVAASESGN